MFTELAPVLKDRAITITVAGDGPDRYRVNVIPHKLRKNKDDDEDKDLDQKGGTEPDILTQPFTVTGTAAELDAELSGLLVEFTEVRAKAAAGLEQFRATAETSRKKVEDETKKLNTAADKNLKAAKDKKADADKKAGVKPVPATGSMFADTDEGAGEKEE